MEISKEIIAEQGWIYKSGFFWYLPWVTECDEISNRGLSWRLNYVAPDRALHIDCYERNAFEWERVYAGPCTTAEELKTIMQLLKLHQKSTLYSEEEGRDIPWSDNIESWERLTND